MEVTFQKLRSKIYSKGKPKLKKSKATRRSQPAPESHFVTRGSKQIQRAGNESHVVSLTQSVPADHTKNAGSSESARRKANQARNSATNLGRGKPSSVVTE